jgi:type IV secretory pathway TrbD component
MPWLYLMVALAAFAVAFNTTSVALVMLCLLVALLGILAWIMGLLAQRVGSRSRDELMMVDPAELHRLREQAETRRRLAAEADATRPAAEPPR